MVVENQAEEPEEEETRETTEAPGEIAAKEFDYLLTMPLWALTYEKVEALQKEMEDKRKEIKVLEATHIHDLWNRDLDHFIEVLEEVEEQEELDRIAADLNKAKGVKGGKKGGKRAPRQKKLEDDGPKKPRGKKDVPPPNPESKPILKPAGGKAGGKENNAKQNQTSEETKRAPLGPKPPITEQEKLV